MILFVLCVCIVSYQLSITFVFADSIAHYVYLISVTNLYDKFTGGAADIVYEYLQKYNTSLIVHSSYF